jgi:hypothetical protein
MTKGEGLRGFRSLIIQRAAFETLLRSPCFEDHRRRLRAQVEHWPPRKDSISPVQERSPSEEAAFRRVISRAVLDSVVDHCSLYYLAFLPEGDAAVRRGGAAVIVRARNAAKHAGKLAIAMRQLWQSGDPTVRRILGPLVAQYPRTDGIPIGAVVLRRQSSVPEDGPPEVFGDPGFVVLLDQLWRMLQFLATTLPADDGGRRPSVVFNKLAVGLSRIYSEITGEPARVSVRSGAPEARLFQFVKAVVAWLGAAASELPDVTFDLPPTDSALRVALGRSLKQTNTTSSLE